MKLNKHTDETLMQSRKTILAFLILPLPKFREAGKFGYCLVVSCFECQLLLL